MKKIMKNSIMLVLLLCIMVSIVQLPAYALSWDGSTSGGTVTGTESGQKAFQIGSYTTDNNIFAYKFSVVDRYGETIKTPTRPNGAVIIARSSGIIEALNSYEDKFTVTYNKTDLIKNQNSGFSTSGNTKDIYSLGSIGASSFPDVSGIKNWTLTSANLNPVLRQLGINGMDALPPGSKVIVEPMFSVQLNWGMYLVTITEMALIGKAMYGANSNGYSGGWYWICNYTNMYWPNALYTPDGQGLWPGVGALGSRATFYNLINNGHGAGIAFGVPDLVTLNLSAYLDGTLSSSLGEYGTVDLYINGALVDNDKNDFSITVAPGSTYEIKDIKANRGYKYNGVYSGSISGTLENDTTVVLNMETQLFHLDLNILYPDGTQPYLSGEAGTVEMSVDGGGWTRVQNEISPSNYPLDAVIKFRNFVPGIGLEAAGVNGATENDDGTWSVEMTEDRIVDFLTQYIPVNLTVNPNGGTWNSSTSTKTFAANYGANKTIALPSRTGYTFTGWRLDGAGAIAHSPVAATTSNTTTYSYGDGETTITSVAAQSGNPTGNANELKIVSTLSASSHRDGFLNSVTSAANQTYIHAFVAKLPQGYEFRDHRNSIGDGGYSEWLTPQIGTGGWQVYAYKVVAGTSGTFSTFGHVAVWPEESNYKPAETVTFYLAAAEIKNVTALPSSSQVFVYGTSDATLTAMWKGNSGTTFKVNHWKQNIGSPATPQNSTNYTLAETKTFSGTTGMTITPDTNIYDGYKSPTRQAVTIASDGSTVVNYYYTLSSVGILTANWNVNHYTIVFDGNKGDGSTEVVGQTPSMEMTYDIPAALPESGFSRVGYVIDPDHPWNTEPDGSGIAYAPGEEVSNLTDVNGATITLYAQWKPIEYTIRFDGNGADSGTMSSMTIKFDETQNLSENRYGKTGNKFNDWNLDRLGGGLVFVDKQEVKNLSVVDGDVIVLYAQWAPYGYIINFHANGGSGSMEPMTMAYGEEKLLTLNEFVHSSADFIKWNTKADGSGVSYQDGERVSNLSSVDGGVIDLYAQWITDYQTITFNPNGGTVEPTSDDFLYGILYNEMPTPSRDRYTFKGWYADFDGTLNSALNLGREYMYTDKISVHLEAYSDNWASVSEQRLISCTENGGWSISNNNGNIVFYLRDSGVGYKNVNTSVAWSSLEPGWHSFDLVFDGTKGYGYLDGEQIGQSEVFVSGQIGYHASNSIFVGAEAVGNASTPGGNYFNGRIRNLVILNSDALTISEFAQNVFQTPNHDFVLYAEWEYDGDNTNKYTIEYDANGGSGYIEPMSMVYGESKELSDGQGFTNGTLTLTSWRGEDGKDYDLGESVKNLTTANDDVFTMYAQWREVPYTLTIDPNGGTYEGSNNLTQYVATPGGTRVISEPFRLGYSFNGWTLTGAGSFENSVFIFGVGNATLKATWLPSSDVVNHNIEIEDGVYTIDSTEAFDYPNIKSNPNDYKKDFTYHILVEDKTSVGSIAITEGASWNVNRISGEAIWTHGGKTYLSVDNRNYVLSNGTWSSVTFSGLTNVTGNYIWSDGINTYHSNNGTNYKFNAENNSWSIITFSGFNNIVAQNIWCVGSTIYYSSGTAHYKLSGTSWTQVIWNGLSDFNGENIWHFDGNTYYSDDNSHYVLNGNTWSQITWSGNSTFSGSFIWTLGLNCYLSNGVDHYILNEGAWERIGLEGSFTGSEVWSDGTRVYASSNSNQYVFNEARLINLFYDERDSYIVRYQDNVNLLYGLDDAEKVNLSKLEYSIYDETVTATAKTANASALTSGKVDLIEGKTYNFSCLCNGTFGTSGNTINVYLYNEETGTRLSFGSNNTTFVASETGTFVLGLEVNEQGKTYTFRELRIVEGNIKSVSGDTEESTHYVDVYDNLTLNEFDRVGYDFLYWTIDPNLSVPSTAYALVLDNSANAEDAVPMIFVRETVAPVVGEMYNSEVYGELEVLAVYEDIEATTADGRPSWFNTPVISSVSSVITEDMVSPTSTEGWFATCFTCDSFVLDKLNVANVTNMRGMFMSAGAEANSLKIVGLETWDTSKVTDMSQMFVGFGFNADKVELDLSNWNTSSLTMAVQMFSNIAVNSSELSLNLSSWDVSGLTDVLGFFDYAGVSANKININLSDWNLSNVERLENMFVGLGTGAQASEDNTPASIKLNLSGWVLPSAFDLQGLFANIGAPGGSFEANLSNWDLSYRSNMVGVFGDAASAVDSFKLIGLDTWDVSPISDMRHMFDSAGSNATYWDIGDISNWDVSNVTDMEGMFSRAAQNANTVSFNASFWNTSNVINMNIMFAEFGLNASEVSLNLSNWNLSNVESMNSMFVGIAWNAVALEEKTPCVKFDLSGWVLPASADISRLFSAIGPHGGSFEADLSNWDITKRSDLIGIFAYATPDVDRFKLIGIDTWDMSNIINVSEMFYHSAPRATSWEVGSFSGWDMPNVMFMTATFAGCTNLTEAPVIPNSVIDMTRTFEGCTSLTGEIEINASYLEGGAGCFYDTVQPIVLTGTSPYLIKLSETDNNDNVTVKRAEPIYGDTVEIGDYNYTYLDVDSYEEWRFFLLNRDLLETDGVTFKNEDEALNHIASVYYEVETYEELGMTKDEFYDHIGLDQELYDDFQATGDIIDGWRVSVIDTSKTEYGEILETVEGKPVVSMNSTFYNCANLIEAPAVPENVTDMRYAFLGCTSLAKSPILPNGVINMCHTFFECTSLTEAPVIPEGVINMDGTFSICTNLIEAPAIPNSVTNMENTFYYCTNLIKVPSISSSVTNMRQTFVNCSNLIEVPAIPEGVTNIAYAFGWCTSLTGELEINASFLEEYEGCFYGTIKPIVLTGTSPYLNELAETDTNDNVTVKSDAVATFTDGTSLTWEELKLEENGDKYGYQAWMITDTEIVGDADTLLGAFAFCDTLTSINIPEGVEIVGAAAFDSCINLTSVNFSKTVNTIEYAAFEECVNLSEVTFSKNSELETINSYAFSSCSSLESIEIPDGTVTIGSDAFYYCESLSAITIPDSVTSIGGFAFGWCKNLETINFTGSVEQWREINLSDDWNYDVPAIEVTCSNGNVSLVEEVNGYATFTDGVTLTWDELKLAENGAKYGYDALAISDTSIGDRAFDFCETIVDLKMPNTVTSIGSQAFSHAVSLNSVTMSDKITSLGSDSFSFYETSGLKKIIFSENSQLTTIGQNAFWDVGLEYIDIPPNVTCIEPGAFYACSITDINILPGNSSYVVSDGALYNKDKTSLIYYFSGRTVETFTVPNGVTSIEDCAFNYSQLDRVIVPNGVTSIGALAFSLSELSYIKLPQSIEYIGDRAFEYCYNLEAIVFDSTIEQWDNIELDENWTYDSCIMEIICLDGTVQVETLINFAVSLTISDMYGGGSSVNYYEYEAKSGMTWLDWIESEYVGPCGESYSFSIDGEIVCIRDVGSKWPLCDSDDRTISLSDIILDETLYFIEIVSGGHSGGAGN